VFSKILIANRGEIAVRVIKTARRLGIATVVVYSEADAGSLAVEMADEAVFIGPAPASESYLRADKIIAACKQTGAEAVHPGFGFLSERAEFARQLEAEGIVFIGPNPAAIDAMGDKIASKRAAAAAGVSTVPGHVGEIDGVPHAIRISEEIGYPVMLKASAGGGGKGIRIAWNRADVEEGFPAVRAEAKGRLRRRPDLIEKFITDPRHIEIQVLGDKHGHVVHLFERECSIQRRNRRSSRRPVAAARRGHPRRHGRPGRRSAQAGRLRQRGHGRVRRRPGQVLLLPGDEHPASGGASGYRADHRPGPGRADDPCRRRRAAGLRPERPKIDGWAVESRIYAEDPYRNFLPSIGRLVRYQPPREGDRGPYTVRNDAGVREGDEISMFYDPMIAKLCAWGADRDAAVDGQARALEDFHIEGLGHNLPFLSAVMDQPRFREGRLSTAYIAEEFPDGFGGLEPSAFQKDIFTAAAAAMHRIHAGRGLRDGAGGQAPRTDWVVTIGDERRPVRLLEQGGALVVELSDENRTLELQGLRWRPGQAQFRAALDGRAFTVTRAAHRRRLPHPPPGRRRPRCAC
jgi:propionyl-CoA carboxylase alpha chain